MLYKAHIGVLGAAVIYVHACLQVVAYYSSWLNFDVFGAHEMAPFWSVFWLQECGTAIAELVHTLIGICITYFWCTYVLTMH